MKTLKRLRTTQRVEFVAALLTLSSLYFLSIGDDVGFIIGALGSILWILLGIELRLYFLIALNAGLFFINLKGAI